MSEYVKINTKNNHVCDSLSHFLSEGVLNYTQYRNQAPIEIQSRAEHKYHPRSGHFRWVSLFRFAWIIQMTL